MAGKESDFGLGVGLRQAARPRGRTARLSGGSCAGQAGRTPSRGEFSATPGGEGLADGSGEMETGPGSNGCGDGGLGVGSRGGRGRPGSLRPASPPACLRRHAGASISMGSAAMAIAARRRGICCGSSIAIASSGGAASRGASDRRGSGSSASGASGGGAGLGGRRHARVGRRDPPSGSISNRQPARRARPKA